MTQSAVAATPYRSYVTRGSHYSRLERLAQDLAPLWQHLGFAIPVEQINISARLADWRPDCSPPDAEIVAKLCAEDIARLDCKFDPQ